MIIPTTQNLTPGGFMLIDGSEIERASRELQRESGKPSYWPSWLWKTPHIGRVFDRAMQNRKKDS